MPDKVLYFPFIRVPNNEWFTRMLLYWDEVGSIVPRQYSDGNMALGRYMTELVDADLVKLVHPNEHIGDIPRFADAFLDLVDETPTASERRRTPTERQTTIRIHVDKMARRLADELHRRGLARPVDPPWHEVEKFTAIRFMAFLAASLGHLPTLQYVPATDKAEYLTAFSSETSGEAALLVLREQLRAAVLEGVLPTPSGGASATSIARFKSRYADPLRGFRRQVESAVIDVVSIAHPDLRTERLGLVTAQLRQEAEELRARMREANWRGIVFGTFCSLAAAAFPVGAGVVTGQPVIAAGSVPGLVNAIYNAFRESQQQRQIIESPLAYAALAQERLG